MEAGAAEGLGSPSKCSAWPRVLCLQPHILRSPVVPWPFLSHGHLPTVAVVTHSMATTERPAESSFCPLLLYVDLKALSVAGGGACAEPRGAGQWAEQQGLKG